MFPKIYIINYIANAMGKSVYFLFKLHQLFSRSWKTGSLPRSSTFFCFVFEEGPSPLSVVTLVEEYCSIMSVFNLVDPVTGTEREMEMEANSPQIICVTLGRSHNISCARFLLCLIKCSVLY